MGRRGKIQNCVDSAFAARFAAAMRRRFAGRNSCLSFGCRPASGCVCPYEPAPVRAGHVRPCPPHLPAPGSSVRVRFICPRPAVRLRRRPSACVARPSTSSSCLQLRPAHPAIAIAKAMARAKAKAMARAITRANAMTKNNYQPSSVTYRRRAGAGHGGLHRRGGRWGACAVQVYEKCARGATKPCKMRARCCIMQNTRWGGVRIVLITGWKGG